MARVGASSAATKAARGRKRKSIPPYKVNGLFGIINGFGTFWSTKVFWNRADAENYIKKYTARNPMVSLEWHAVIPVNITIEAASD